MTAISRQLPLASLLLMALGILCAQNASAQAALLGPGAAYLSTGVSTISIGELDDRLAAHGYPTFGQTAFSISIGGYRTFSNRVMLGAEWNGLIIGEEAHQGGEVGLGGGYGTLSVGYFLQASPRVRYYPRVGIGGGGMGVWFENDPDPTGFDEVLADPHPAPDVRKTVLSRDGPVVDLGAGAEFLPSSQGGGLMIGLRLGYLIAPFDEPWVHQHELPASGGPDGSISGPYVRALIGLAWSR